MDRLPPTPPTPGNQEASPPASASSTGEGNAARVVTLRAGTTVRATVAMVHGDGRVLLRLSGGLLEATSQLPLEAGRSYEFTVARTVPYVQLTAARPLEVPGARVAASSSLLGPPPQVMGDLPRQLTDLAAVTGEPAAGGSKASAQLARSMAAPGVSPSAAQLQALAETLGHDQEARVLRLVHHAPSVRKLEVARLQTTAKAEALVFLEQLHHGPAAKKAVQAARALVRGLGMIEKDNAARAEQGAPLWFPLPAVHGGPLRDARMFVPLDADDEGDRGKGGERPFTVVLLLDLTSLGMVRVDVDLQDGSVGAVFTAEKPIAVQKVHQCLAALRESLEALGMSVRKLQARQGARGQVPIGDLVVHRPLGGGDSMVDLHA